MYHITRWPGSTHAYNIYAYGRTTSDVNPLSHYVRVRKLRTHRKRQACIETGLRTSECVKARSSYEKHLINVVHNSKKVHCFSIIKTKTVNFYVYFCCPLGAFGKLRRRTISFVMSVCPSECARGATRLPTGRIFIKCYI